MNLFGKLFAVAAFASLPSSLLAQNQPGAYSVPVSDPALVEYARLQMPHLHAVVEKDGNLKLNYKLPFELDGVEPRDFSIQGNIVLGGATTQLYGTGSNGQAALATCTVSNPVNRQSDLRCQIEYPDLNVNKTGALEYISTIETDPTRVEKLGSVVEIFAFKPIGIVETKVRIKKKPRDR
jgi:hypothetical protein